MIKLTRQELVWIMYELEKSAAVRKNFVNLHPDANEVMKELIILRAENLLGISVRINKAFSDNDKRIAII